MQRIFSQIVLLVGLFFPFAIFADTVQNYILDPGHTFVVWHINHFGFSNPTGKWMANGTLAIDEAHPENSKLNVAIKVGDIVTAIPKLDAHLNSADFFDAAKFPVATFVSDKVDVTGTTAKVSGTLTVHGVSKPVVLDVTLNKNGISPMTQNKTLGFTASTTIKRSDFGINKYLPGLGDDVKLDIEAEASLPPTKTVK